MKLFNSPLKTAAVIGTGAAAAVFLSATPSVADTDLQPISAPTVVYPAEMASQGIGAECEAKFDVSINGEPENITATCTHPGFIEVTRTAAETLRFHPKMVDGVAVRSKDVVYPIVFQMSEATTDVKDSKPQDHG